MKEHAYTKAELDNSKTPSYESISKGVVTSTFINVSIVFITLIFFLNGGIVVINSIMSDVISERIFTVSLLSLITIALVRSCYFFFFGIIKVFSKGTPDRMVIVSALIVNILLALFIYSTYSLFQQIQEVISSFNSSM